MRVIVPAAIQDKLRSLLQRAGTREIGGVLMGEHLGEDQFAVRSITGQTNGGTFASFVRLVQGLLAPLTRYFRQTDHQYRRFNYLGEWHSHPSFSPEPSTRDADSMWEIVDDPEVGANFAVLLIVRLSDGDVLEGTATVFAPQRHVEPAELLLEGEAA